MSVFFDQNGILNLDESIVDMESFKKIMEDGVVTDDEVKEQADRVSALLHDVEKVCSTEQSVLVRELLAEMSVLFSVYHYKEFQTIK